MKSIKAISTFGFYLSLFLTESTLLFGQVDIPKVVPPTPEAEKLFQFIDYPVDNSAGLAQISIPLYEIKSGSISVPISLGYHSSGRKVYDDHGAVATDWVLNAGGMVSRIICGNPDDQLNFPIPWKNQQSILNNYDLQLLLGITRSVEENVPSYDSEYDIFSFSANQISGKFILRDSVNIKTPLLLPKKPYKIQFNSPGSFDYFNIIDDKGIFYRFGRSIYNNESYYELGSDAYGSSGWLLTEIISADKSDTIHFVYTNFIKRSNYESSESRVITNYSCNPYGLVDRPYERAQETPTITSISSTYIQRLTQILFREGSVTFNLRNDYPNEYSRDLVKDITIKDKSGNLIRTINFWQTDMYSVSPNPPGIKLDSIQFKDSNLKCINKYSFEYYPTLYNSQNYNHIPLTSRDMWGYYNGNSSVDIVPYYEINVAGDLTPTGNSSVDREPHLDYMQSGLLKKIYFPTGGNTEFLYELNRFRDPSDNQIKNGGGLRVNSKITREANGSIYNKEYRYGKDNDGDGIEDGYGFLPFVPNLQTRSYQISHWSWGHIVTNGIPYHYDQLYSETVFSSDVLPCFYYLYNKPIVYDQITEYQGIVSNNIGKSVFCFDSDFDYLTQTSIPNLFLNREYKYWGNSVLTHQFDYERINQAPWYKLRRKIVNNYIETTYPNEKAIGLHIRRKLTTAPTDICSLDRSAWYVANITHPSSVRYCKQELGIEPFDYGDYAITSGDKKLTSRYATEYFGSDSVTSCSTYDYNNRNLIYKTHMNTSKGNDDLVTENKYPFDAPISIISQEMIDRNMLDYTIESNKYKNLTFIESAKTDYFHWENNIIAPITVQTKLGTNAYETRLRYHSYDNKGNVTSFSKENDVNISYLWGYNQTLPVAKIENATIDQVKTVLGGSIPDFGISGLGTYESILRNSTILSNALITTYTYKPLIGMASQTDPNGKTTYYEYDDFGRLKFTKDDQGKILKKFDYHYKE